MIGTENESIATCCDHGNLVSFAFVTTASAEYYIVQNNTESRGVTDALTGYGCSIIFVPYASRNAAEHDLGTGTSRLPCYISGVLAPSVARPRGNCP